MITGILVDDELRDFWLETFQTMRVPLVSSLPVLVMLPTSEKRYVYQVNLDVLKMREMERLSGALLKKFGMAPEELTKFLRSYGLPIPIESVKVER